MRWAGEEQRARHGGQKVESKRLGRRAGVREEQQEGRGEERG